MEDNTRSSYDVEIISKPPMYASTTQLDVTSPCDRKRSRVNRKCVIISVAVAVTVAIVAAAILVGVKFYLDTQVTIEEIRMKFGDVTVEQENRDTKTSRVVTYHLDDKDDVEMWIMIDASKDIQVMKIKTSSSVMCTVTPLDQLTAPAVDLNQPLENLASTPRNSSATRLEQFRLSAHPIQDTTIIGYDGQKLCRDVDVYWSYAPCEVQSSASPTGSTGASSRQRRAYGFYRCQWDWNNCDYFTFEGSTRRYYRCAMKCTAY